MDKLSVVGKRLPKIDVLDRVTGQAKYSVDIELPRMLYGKILRSPYPHAKILGISTSKAERVLGIKAVVTAEDTPKVKYGFYIKDEEILHSDKVRYIGDEVAAVAAIDEDVAEEALDLIEVDYEELPPVMSPEEAMGPGATRIHDVDRNIPASFKITRGDIKEGFREAECILEEKFITSSVHHCYLEGICSVASFDNVGKLTLWSSSMHPSGLRLSLAEALGMTESNLRILQCHVGGAFGNKVTMHSIYPISALLSKKAGRPVKMKNAREEEFSAALRRPCSIIQLKMGAKKDGQIVAKEAKVIFDTGAYCNLGPYIAIALSTRIDSLYRLNNVKTETYVVYTNKIPVTAFRGFGIIQMAFAVESMVEMLAEKLGMDPMELRLKNATQTGDVTCHGYRITSCGLSQCIQNSAQRAGWKRKEKLQSRGMGMASTIFVTDHKILPGFGGSNAYVKILEDGKARIVTGESDYGQGAHTIYAQIAAEELGISWKDVTISPLDTDVIPYALGPYGDRLTISGGNAVRLAAIDARERLMEVAGNMLEASMEDLELVNGKIYVKGSPEKALSIAEVAKEAMYSRGGSSVMGKGTDERDSELIDPITLYGNTSSAYTFSNQVVEVEVDRETGKVKVLKVVSANDLGRAINPMLAEAQVEGAILQGMGYGLMEGIIWEKGKVMNPSFMAYGFPTAIDSPSSEVILVESNDPKGPYGAKGVAEPGIIPIAPATANAISNAIGVRVKEIPISPDRIHKALEKQLYREA